MTVKDLINQFRQINGKEPVRNWNRVLDDHCLSHVLAMINSGKLYHAPEYYRKGYGEAVACCDFITDWETTLRCLIFDVIGNSPEHREILLESQEIGYGIMSDKNRVFITIRGK